MQYKVITPAGPIFVATLEEAKEYQRLYGWVYVKINPK
jgi:hypothetical protein